MIEANLKNDDNGSLYLGVLFSLLIHLLFFTYSGNVFLWERFQRDMSQQALELKEEIVIDIIPFVKSSAENTRTISVRLTSGPSVFSIEHNQSSDLTSLLSGQSEEQENEDDLIKRLEPNLSEELPNNSEITHEPFHRSDLIQTPQESIEELTGALKEFRQARLQIPPVYPLDAQSNKWEGVVELGFWIAGNGYVRNIEVISSSGYQSLDISAKTALRMWEYDISKIGASLPRWKTIRFVFKLNEFAANN